MSNAIMTMATRERPKRVARKLIQETSPTKGRSPNKRSVKEACLVDSQPGAKRAKIEEDEDVPNSMTTKSFYGKKPSRYVTPLERKAKRESQENDSENLSHSSADESENEICTTKNSRKGNNKSESHKNNPKKLENGSLENSPRPLSEINSSSPRLSENKKDNNGHIGDSPDSISSSGSSSKRFFKTRTPQLNNKRPLHGKKRQTASASKMTQKGIRMVYKPASMKTKVAPSSPDIKWKKSSLDSSLVRRSPRKLLTVPQVPNKSALNALSCDNSGSDSVIASPSLRRSPRKLPICASSPANSLASADLFASMNDSRTSISSIETPEEKGGGKAESPRSQSSCADSVLLLSELESESNTSNSPDKKKIHPFFSQGTPQHLKKSLNDASSRSSTPRSKKSSIPSPSSSPNVRAAKLKDDQDQYIIDAGQKMTPMTQCKNCGLTYNSKDGTDSATHQKFHARVMNTLRFPGWKNENVAQDFLDGSRIIVVVASEKSAMKKVNAVKQIVDEDLGFVVDGTISRLAQIYMYVSADKKIVGFCIAEEIKSAYRMIAQDSQTASPLSPSDSSQPWCCSTEPEPARCGINRIWVLSTDRRKGIARKLLDAVRCAFVMGLVLRKGDLAFTDPTPDGRNLAASYTGTPSFLVYKHSGKMSSQ